MTTNFSEYVACRRERRDHVGVTAEMFGFVDAKGREIGYRCAIVEEFWVVVPLTASSTTVVDTRWLPEYLDRQIWKVLPQPTRDGKDYGASINAKVVSSKADADMIAAKMIASYRKKMAKQFA